MKKLLSLLIIAQQCFCQSIGSDVGAFAFELHTTLDKKTDNLAFSPYGIFSNLALLYYGAQNKTADQIQKAIHMSGDKERFLTVFPLQLKAMIAPQEGGCELTVANALFLHQGTHLLNTFEQIAKESFDAKLQLVDFAAPTRALSTINGYIAEKTKGKIPAILQEDDISGSTRLVMANAVFFKGNWLYPFSDSATKKAPFYPDTGEKFETSTLVQTRRLPYVENAALQCISLPFVRKGAAHPLLECLIVLPKTGSLTDFESTFTYAQLNALIDSLDFQQLEIEIPKFCFSSRFKLDDPLKALGMQIPFTHQADFSKITGAKDLLLSAVLHETHFSFHQRGVTAAAATTSSIGVTSTPPSAEEGIPFRANHPFLFFIIDNRSRSILFMGRCTKPKVITGNGS